MSRFAAVHCAAPLGLGGFLYLSWRPAGLLMFDWAEALGLGGALASWRSAVAASGELVPEPVLYRLGVGVGGELGQLVGVGARG